MTPRFAFSARPRDPHGTPTPGPRREFSPGEVIAPVARVYVGEPADNPVGWTVVFKAAGDEGGGPGEAPVYRAPVGYFSGTLPEADRL